MSLKQQLSDDLTAAIRSGDETRKSTLRMLMTAVNTQEVSGSERKELDDAAVTQVIAKQVKQRRESAEEFRKAGREDLASKEDAEMAVLQEYMPEQAGREEIEAEARKAIEEAGSTGPQDKGKVMQIIMPRLSGKAEGRDINEVVTELLASL
ncbi:MAG TPA: GatB/YqeY domain-containing protein [Dehalococcoidia bacterium]|nr:GatB/YqeY domain-containing protein [Dehalococcoidia bacterium]